MGSELSGLRPRETRKTSGKGATLGWSGWSIWFVLFAEPANSADESMKPDEQDR